MLDDTCLNENYYTQSQNNQACAIVIECNTCLIIIFNLLFIKECKFKI